MRKLTITLAVLALCASLARAVGAAPTRPHTYQGPVPLPATGALFGAYVSADGHTGNDRRSAMTGFETLVGRKMALDRVYYFWNDQFPTADDYWSRDQGRTLILSWNAGMSDGSFVRWADIAAGLYDDVVDARAIDVKAFGAPVFFAFHHEPPNPVPGGEHAGSPEEFIAAWQHIRDRWVADGVTNVTWTLIHMAFTYQQGNADQWYPGDGYVDVLGADGYNWNGCVGHNGPWRLVRSIFIDFYNWGIAHWGIAHGKPMIVAEWGSGEDMNLPGRKADWFTDAQAWFKTWPEIKGLSYYENAPLMSCARWVDTSATSLTAFQALGADPYYNPTALSTNVAAADFSFSPATSFVMQASSLLWTFDGPSSHTATDATGLGLFDSGPVPPGGTFAYTFTGAGTYRYRCTIHPTLMKGTVLVPVAAWPPLGGVTTVFTITWASAPPAPGYSFDVQVQRPGQTTWSNWRPNQTLTSSTFIPDAGVGNYSFRARLKNASIGKASGYSAAESIVVS